MKTKRLVVKLKEGEAISSLIPENANEVEVSNLFSFEKDRFKEIHSSPLNKRNEILEKRIYESEFYSGLDIFDKEKYRTFTVDSTNEELFKILKNRANDEMGIVKDVYEDGYLNFHAIPNDSEFTMFQKTIYQNLGIIDSWDNAKGDGVLVAVVDTGVFTHHLDLQKNLWNGNGAFGYSIDSEQTMKDDGADFGHGTPVAGIISALMNNFGVVGVAPNSKVLMLKLDLSEGEAFMTSAAKAFRIAKKSNAKIVNCSFGVSSLYRGDRCEIEFQKVINDLSKDLLFVFSTGNGRGGVGIDIKKTFLNELNGVLKVGAVQNDGTIELYSNFGSGVIYAFGDLRSTSKDGTYKNFKYTSAAAPQVSGVCALLMSYAPNASIVEIKTILESTSKGFTSDSEIKLIQAQAAFNDLKKRGLLLS